MIQLVHFDREERTRQATQDARHADPRVAKGSDADPDGLSRVWVLARRAQSQSETGLAQHEEHRDRQQERQRDDGRHVLEGAAEPEGQRGQQGHVELLEVRDAGLRLRCLAEEGLREEAAHADGDDVDHDARDDVVDTERDRGQRVHQRESESASGSDHKTRHRPPLQRPPGAHHRSDDHDPLETDVHDARALAEQPPEPGEIDDREVAQSDRDRDAEIKKRHPALASSRSPATSPPPSRLAAASDSALCGPARKRRRPTGSRSPRG